MDLYHILTNDDDFLDCFCDILEDNLSNKAGHRVNIGFKKNEISIFFFIDGSSLLQVIPDKDLQYRYANVPSYEDEITNSINIIEIKYNRDKKIEYIIKKES